jgi:hypothetical protein
MEALIADFLAHNNRPDLALIEVSNVMEISGIMAKALLPLIDLESQTMQLIEKNDAVDANLSRWLRLYRLNGEIFLRGLYYALQSSDQDWTGQIGLINQSMIEIARAKSLMYSQDNFEPLLRTLKVLETHKVHSRLVLAPYHPAALERNDRVANFVDRLRQRMPESIPIFDFSHELSDDKYFSDPYHLNQDGAAAMFTLGLSQGLFTGVRHCEL